MIYDVSSFYFAQFLKKSYFTQTKRTDECKCYNLMLPIELGHNCHCCGKNVFGKLRFNLLGVYKCLQKPKRSHFFPKRVMTCSPECLAKQKKKILEIDGWRCKLIQNKPSSEELNEFVDEHRLEDYKCGYCGNYNIAGTHKMYICKRCDLEFYCNTDCQHKHWEEHKKVCKRRVKAAKGKKTKLKRFVKRCHCMEPWETHLVNSDANSVCAWKECSRKVTKCEATWGGSYFQHCAHGVIQTKLWYCKRTCKRAYDKFRVEGCKELGIDFHTSYRE